jgi:acetyl-CoA carboxylase biotin carboxyl carrier protein
MNQIDLEKIQKLIDIAKKRNVVDFSLEQGDLKVAFSFLSQTTIEYPAASVTSREVPVTSTTATQAASPAAVATSNLVDTIAPFVGTYYASPAPGEPAYVKVGDIVKKGQTLCIIEAMKIMNEIEASADGTIAQISVENESFVEYGQVLYKIKPH